MKKRAILGSVALVAAAVVGGLLWQNSNTASDNVASTHILTQQPVTSNEANAVARGRYIAIAADCVACHTAPGSQHPFAGGYSISTPFGGIIASNITPDPQTGIGNWTERDFFRAVRHGKGKQGENLYPAMPYNDYVKINDQDMHDLWLYMRTIEPVNHAVPATDLGFPFNIRLAMMGWNLLFYKNEGFKADPDHTAQWNRGAYLVDALEHCGACHTAKNFLGGDVNAYLQGSNLGEWHAPDLTPNSQTGIGDWSIQQIVDYLKLGSNHVAVASGPMAEAVTNSTQHLTDNDLQAIAVYLKSLPASPAIYTEPQLSNNAMMKSGENVYQANCSACHNSNGRGIPNLAASLANNPSIRAQDTSSILTTILQGGQGAATIGNPTSGAMPSFAWKLSDKQVAAVATYIRNSWGNVARPVTPSEVTKARKELKLPQQMSEH